MAKECTQINTHNVSQPGPTVKYMQVRVHPSVFEVLRRRSFLKSVTKQSLFEESLQDSMAKWAKEDASVPPFDCEAA